MFYIIIIDGVLTLKLNDYTFVPGGSSAEVFIANTKAEDSVEVNFDGGWYNHSKLTFWDNIGEREYEAATWAYIINPKPIDEVGSN